MDGETLATIPPSALGAQITEGMAHQRRTSWCAHAYEGANNPQRERGEGVVNVEETPVAFDTFVIEPQLTAQGRLAKSYVGLIDLPDGQLQRRLVELIEAEDRLPERERHAAARDRLLAWLELGADQRHLIARAFERALATLPADFAARRREAERAAILNGMRFEEFGELASFVPWISEEASAATPLVPSGFAPGGDEFDSFILAA